MAGSDAHSAMSAQASHAASKLPSRRSLPAGSSSDGRLGPRRDLRVSDAPTRRIAVRIAVSSIRFEVAMLAIVLFYSVLVFAQLAMDDPEIETLLGEGGTDITAMHDAFLKVGFGWSTARHKPRTGRCTRLA